MSPTPRLHARIPTRLLGFLGWAFAILMLIATATRVYYQYHPGGAYDVAHGGMTDFHNGAYYPAMAMRIGISPYGDAFANSFPVARATPAYSPFIIALHLPLTLLPLPHADVAYYLFSVFILLLTLFVVVHEIQRSSDKTTLSKHLWLLGWVAAFLFASRGGHTTLFNGYFTPILIFGNVLALSVADRKPWLAGFGIMLAACKPNYAVPLGLVLLARGNFKALAWGVGLSMMGGLIPAWWIATHSSWTDLLETIRQGQSAHMADPRELPINTWTRIDLTAIIAKWLKADPSESWQLLAMCGWLLVPCYFLFRLQRQNDREGITSLSGLISVLAILVSIYHQVYDAMLLIGVVVALTIPVGPFRDWTILQRLAFGILVTTTWWNYFASEMVMNRLKVEGVSLMMLTSLGAISLAASLLFACWMATKKRGTT